MANKTLTIAIYSGEIPSTTFVERLILGLARQSVRVYLFGAVNARMNYPKNVRNLGYRQQRLLKIIYLFRYSVLLFIFKYREKKRLDNYLKEASKFSLYDRVKCYPVLWQQPDVFHVQWAKGINDWMWVQDFGMKLVLSLRGAHINYSPIADLALASMFRKHFPSIDGFHAVSKVIGLEAEKYGANRERIKVIYSGLNLSSFNLKQDPHNDIFKIVSVGRPHWKKGFSYALDACKILKNKNVSFQYTIVGAEKDIELQYQIYDLGLQNEVCLLSSLSFDAVQCQMQNSNLLLLPSVEEGIANVVLEAMSLSTLVFTANCGGMQEVIQDGINGFICPIRDSQAIADKIIEIKGLPVTTVESILVKAKETITKQHSQAEMVDGMCQLYEDVMTKRN